MSQLVSNLRCSGNVFLATVEKPAMDLRLLGRGAQHNFWEVGALEVLGVLLVASPTQANCYCSSTQLVWLRPSWGDHVRLSGVVGALLPRRDVEHKHHGGTDLGLVHVINS